MRPEKEWIILAACALALCGPARAPGSWGAGCFPAVGGGLLMAQVPAMPAADAGYDWRPLDADECVLYHNFRQVGNYRYADGLFFQRLPGGGFEAEASEPPVPVPPALASKRKCGCSDKCACSKKKCGCSKEKRCNDGCRCGVKVIGSQPAGGCACTGEAGECHCPLDCVCGPTCIKNYGVSRAEISPTERVTIMGREVTKEEAREALEADGVGKPDKPDAIPDDTKKNSLSVIGGTEEQRKQVRDDLAQPKFAAWTAEQLYQEYPADSPMLKCGFKVSPDHPTIYYQKADGTVLARVDGYEGVKTIEAVRKTDPNYDPSKDPDPTKPQPLSGPDGGGVHPGVVFGVVGGGLCFLLFMAGCLLGFVLLVRAVVRWLAKS